MNNSRLPHFYVRPRIQSSLASTQLNLKSTQPQLKLLSLALLSSTCCLLYIVVKHFSIGRLIKIAQIFILNVLLNPLKIKYFFSKMQISFCRLCLYWDKIKFWFFHHFLKYENILSDHFLIDIFWCCTSLGNCNFLVDW